MQAENLVSNITHRVDEAVKVQDNKRRAELLDSRLDKKGLAASTDPELAQYKVFYMCQFGVLFIFLWL